MPPANQTLVNRWPASHAGLQLRKGPACWAYAWVNCALAAGVPDADRLNADALYKLACARDGIDERTNRTHGTSGAAVAAAWASLMPEHPVIPISAATAPAWVRDYGPVAAAIAWRYPAVGLIGTTYRRQPGPLDTNHSVALVGFDGRHRTWLWMRRPAFLVLDSQHPSRRAWLPEADFLADCVECFGFTAVNP